MSSNFDDPRQDQHRLRHPADTTVDGAKGDDAVTSTSYASTPTTFSVTATDGTDPTLTTLVSFNNTDALPYSGVIADAAGNLFGTTSLGGADFSGTLFEIATSTETSTGYASTPATLVSFNDTDGYEPVGGLIADAAGDLFGTTEGGGMYGDGTVFEIAKTSTGYAGTPTTLVSFNDTTANEGAVPQAGLIADAAGDLFGTTSIGGEYGDGTVFELVNNGGGSYRTRW